MTHWTHEHMTYIWTPATPPTTLYGSGIHTDSLIPDGMSMTLRNQAGEELLRLRGEQHGDVIAFFHITDGREIGAWVPLATPPLIAQRQTADAWPPVSPPITENERQALFRSKIAQKLGWG